MEFISYLGEANIITFFLLFIRMCALMVFFPFFYHAAVPIVVKAALAFLLAIVLFQVATPVATEMVNLQYLVLETLAELAFGLCAGVFLMLVFAAVQMAGEQISMIMGLSMASTVDPQSGVNTPLISNVLGLIVLISFLLFDGHHLVLYFFAYSLEFVPLGGFYPTENILTYIGGGVAKLFLFGFILSFPILALSLMADLIFGMLMKTMPQFNLLVVGFPIKIAVAFTVLTAILGAIIKIFTTLMTSVLNDMPRLFF